MENIVLWIVFGIWVVLVALVLLWEPEKLEDYDGR
jgi:hypothetical protein